MICDKIHRYGYGDNCKGIDIGKYVNRYIVIEVHMHEGDPKSWRFYSSLDHIEIFFGAFYKLWPFVDGPLSDLWNNPLTQPS